MRVPPEGDTRTMMVNRRPATAARLFEFDWRFVLLGETSRHFFNWLGHCFVAHACRHLHHHVGVVNQELLGVLATLAELLAVVDEAATKNVPVLAHAHGDEGAYAAVKAGVRSIEHGTYLSDSTLALMKARGTYLVATYSTLVDLVEPGGDYDDPVTKARGMHMMPRMEETFKKAHGLGIKMVTGADVSYTPLSITRVSHEVTNFVKLGMTPLEALQSATITAAELFRIEKKTGAIEPGLEADLIVVEHNPLEVVRTLQDVLFVMSNGRIAVDRLRFGKI